MAVIDCLPVLQEFNALDFARKHPAVTAALYRYQLGVLREQINPHGSPVVFVQGGLAIEVGTLHKQTPKGQVGCGAFVRSIRRRD